MENINYLENSNSISWYRIANWISVLTLTPLISIPVFLIISYYLLPVNDFLIVGSVSVFFGGILPFMLCYLYAKKKNLEIDIPSRKDRIYPLLMVIPSYIIGLILLYTLGTPAVITVLMFCYFSITIVVLLISLYWKISLHSMGVAGPAVFLIYIFGIPGLIFSLIIPLVMWSRVYLHKHTVPQVIMGALLGFLLTAIQIYILLK
ncbi:MAG: phosphatase PAP2 family protein [Methanobacterium sp.]